MEPRLRRRIQTEQKRQRDAAITEFIGKVTDDSPVVVTINGVSRDASAGELLVADSYVPHVGDRVLVVRRGQELPVVVCSIGTVGGAPEAMHAPTFATGWSNFGGAYSEAGYYKDRERVYLRGAVKNGGTGTSTIFTLPTGYRPPGGVVKRISLFNGSGDLLIKANGDVVDNTFNVGTSKVTTFLAADFRV